jgi:TPR repeat protein
MLFSVTAKPREPPVAALRSSSKGQSDENDDEMMRKRGSYEDGAAAYNRGDYTAARRLWLPLAEEGNADAQTMLGIMYEEGQSVTQDFAVAVTWYRRAADQGHPDAQFYLACMHDFGKGVPLDSVAAAKWLTKAADQGHADAQFSLGVMYEDGIGVSQDPHAAVTLYRKAAEQGHAKAQNNLGTLFVKGQGVSQDYHSAAAWFRKAAAQGDAEGEFNLALMYENGTGVPQNPHAAMTWYRVAAKHGHTVAQAQPCAKAQEQPQREQESHVLRDSIAFVEAFQKLLQEVAANAPKALHRDPLIASTQFSSLYSPAEIVSGISAAEDAGLSVEQGVICFVMLSAAIEAELQKRSGLLQRLKTKLTPRQGARANAHSVMFNYLCERPPGGHMPDLEAFRLFASAYNENLGSERGKNWYDGKRVRLVRYL